MRWALLILLGSAEATSDQYASCYTIFAEADVCTEVAGSYTFESWVKYDDHTGETIVESDGWFRLYDPIVLNSTSTASQCYTLQWAPAANEGTKDTANSGDWTYYIEAYDTSFPAATQGSYCFSDLGDHPDWVIETGWNLTAYCSGR